MHQTDSLALSGLALGRENRQDEQNNDRPMTIVVDYFVLTGSGIFLSAGTTDAPVALPFPAFIALQAGPPLLPHMCPIANSDPGFSSRLCTKILLVNVKPNWTLFRFLLHFSAFGRSNGFGRFRGIIDLPGTPDNRRIKHRSKLCKDSLGPIL